jgi:hypothetical protein
VFDCQSFRDDDLKEKVQEYLLMLLLDQHAALFQSASKAHMETSRIDGRYVGHELQSNLQSSPFVPEALPRLFAKRADIWSPPVLKVSLLHDNALCKVPLTDEFCSTTTTPAQSDQHLVRRAMNACCSFRAASDIVSSGRSGNMSDNNR